MLYPRDSHFLEAAAFLPNHLGIRVTSAQTDGARRYLASTAAFTVGLDSTLRDAFVESATDQHGVVEVKPFLVDKAFPC